MSINEDHGFIEIDIAGVTLNKYERKYLKLETRTNSLFHKHSSELNKWKLEIKTYLLKIKKLEKSVTKSRHIDEKTRAKLVTNIGDVKQKLNILMLGAKQATSKDCFFRKYELIVVNIIITSTVMLGILFLAILIWYAQ